MAVTPTGMFSSPLANTKTLLAALPVFQTWVGAANAIEAAEHVYLVQFDEPPRGDQADAEWLAARQAKRPLCIVGYGDTVTGEEDATGTYWHKTGSMVVMFEEIAQNENGSAWPGNTVETNDAITHLMNHVGAILEAIESAVSGGGYVDLVGWTLRENPGRMPAEEVSAGQLDIIAISFQFDRRDS